MQELERTTFEVTNLLAAQAIAHPSFPDDATLPRVARLPSSNLGHQPLLDYHRFATIVWGTAALLEQERARIGRPWAEPLALTTGVLIFGPR